jgi:hypothetical protein
MKIAQIAPLMESVPPRLYGGTERIVSYLTEELVRLGHEVNGAVRPLFGRDSAEERDIAAARIVNGLVQIRGKAVMHGRDEALLLRMLRCRNHWTILPLRVGSIFRLRAEVYAYEVVAPK